MADSKDTGQKTSRIPFPLLAAAYLFFLPGVRVGRRSQSVAFFADSIIFLEGASVSILMWPRLDWTLPGRQAFAGFSRTMIFCSDVLHVMFDSGKLLRCGNSCCGADGYDWRGDAAEQYRLAKRVEPRHVRTASGEALAGSKACGDECCGRPGCFSDLEIRDDVAGRRDRSRNSVHECGRWGAC